MSVRHRALITASCAIALAILPRFGAPARGNPLFETVGGIGSPNPFTARIMATGPEAAYFDPALLPDVDDTFALGFFVLAAPLDIDLRARPNGIDVADSVYNAFQKNADGTTSPLAFRPLPTEKLAPRGSDDDSGLKSYITIGVAKHLIKDRFVVGLIAMLPTASFQQQGARFSDERQEFFTNGLAHELYGDRLGMMTLALGVGGRIVPWLSWGAGFTLGLATTTINPVYVPDASNQRQILITSDTSVDTSLAPHFALAVKASDFVQFALTLHARAKSETRGTNLLKFWSYDYEPGETAITQKFQFVNGFDPLTIGAGVRVTLPSDATHRWQIGLELRWRAWSDYLDRVGEHPVDAWSDVATAALGIRYVSNDTTVHVDGAWVPSPVPDQTGASSYVDEDRIGLAGGVGTRVDILGVKIRADLDLELQRLVPRSVTKSPDAKHPVRDEFPDDSVDALSGASIPAAAGLQTNDPGYPGYESSGWLIGAGVTLKVDL